MPSLEGGRWRKHIIIIVGHTQSYRFKPDKEIEIEIDIDIEIEIV